MNSNEWLLYFYHNSEVVNKLFASAQSQRVFLSLFVMMTSLYIGNISVTKDTIPYLTNTLWSVRWRKNTLITHQMVYSVRSCKIRGKAYVFNMGTKILQKVTSRFEIFWITAKLKTKSKQTVHLSLLKSFAKTSSLNTVGEGKNNRKTWKTRLLSSSHFAFSSVKVALFSKMKAILRRKLSKHHKKTQFCMWKLHFSLKQRQTRTRSGPALNSISLTKFANCCYWKLIDHRSNHYFTKLNH